MARSSTRSPRPVPCARRSVPCARRSGACAGRRGPSRAARRGPLGGRRRRARSRPSPAGSGLGARRSGITSPPGGQPRPGFSRSRPSTFRACPGPGDLPGDLLGRWRKAGRSRLLDLIACKADWRGREIVGIARWFPGRQTCGRGGARHPEIKELTRRPLVCACGHIMGRDRNASVNRLPAGRGKGDRSGRSDARGDRNQPGGPALPAVPVVDARMLAHVEDHECL